MKLLHAASIALLAAAAPGCGALYVEGEVPEVCVTLPPMSIPITRLTGASGRFLQAVDFSLADALPDFVLQGSSGERTLQLTQLTIGLPPGQPPGANLDWLTSAQLEVVPPPGSPLPTQSLVQYAKGASALPITQVAFQPSGNPNLTTYIAMNQLALRLSGNAQYGTTVPASEAVVVRGCFDAMVRVTVQEMIDAGK
jgi:hypothetical protein